MGLGDIISWLIKVVTFGLLKECASCKKRKEFLNRLIFWKKECPCKKKKRPCDCEKKKEECDCEKAGQK
jgi:hypothetical protein|tara:strand:+ start:1726 stop:1932 length:207 start_codon:yes stop_codon:yes gene_type:complete